MGKLFRITTKLARDVRPGDILVIRSTSANHFLAAQVARVSHSYSRSVDEEPSVSVRFHDSYIMLRTDMINIGRGNENVDVLEGEIEDERGGGVLW